MKQTGGRQLCALTFCAFTVPAIVVLPRAGWLFGGLAVIGVAGLLLWLRPRCSGLAQNAAETPFGKVALALTTLWNFLMLGAGARLLCGAFPRGNALIGLLLLLLAAYAASRGVEVLVRVGAICFFFLTALYAVLFAFSLPDMKTEWLAPQGKADWRLLSAALLPVCAVWLADGKKKIGLWLAGGLAFALLAGVVTAGSVSPQFAAQEMFPFYSAAKSVRVLGAMERLEPLVSAAVTAGGFCMLGLLCAVNARLCAALAPRAERSMGMTNFLCGGALLWGSSAMPATILAAGTAIFWGIIPLFLPLVVKKEKT